LNGAVGRSAVLLGFVAAMVGVGVLGVGLARRRPEALRQGPIYAGLVLLGALVATGAMEHALLTHDFSLRYVADNNSRETPLLFTITGMWSALEGSILLWGLILAGYMVLMVWHFRRRATDQLVAWATLVTLSVSVFFFGLMLGPANPFRAVGGLVPADGTGPNPLLQDHPLVAFHPPLLYLGMVGFTIPFALAIAGLATGRLGDGWLVEARRWTLFAWGFLTVGLVLGAWWSYQVLGWGGFWAWDPVENAALLPWLCGTAYLHSAMSQDRHGLLRVWNLALLVATFSLTILGTFLTRSGVLQSVHSFSDGTVGPVILAFFAAVVAAGVGLIGWRGDQLRGQGRIDAPISRQAAFLANNVLFSAFAFVVLLGTVFPLLAEAVNGKQITVGRPYFDTMTTPLGLALLFLMAIAPALPWHGASGQLLRARLVWPAWAATLTVLGCVAAGLRGLATLVAFGLGAFAGTGALRQLVVSNRLARRRGEKVWQRLGDRANGGMVVHLGVVVIAVALAASMSYGQRGQFRLGLGKSVTFAGHTVTYLGTHSAVQPSRSSLVANLRVDGGGTYHPAISQFGADTQGIGTPSVDSGLTGDVYVTLIDAPQSGSGPATIGVVVQPLVMWLWLGGAIMALGTLMAVVPGRRRRGHDAVAAEESEAAVVAGAAGPADVAVPVGTAVALGETAARPEGSPPGDPVGIQR